MKLMFVAATYLASILTLQTLAVLLTVIYIDIYHRPTEEPVPEWVRTAYSCCLGRLVCAGDGRKSTKDATDSSVVTPRPFSASDNKIHPIDAVVSDWDIGKANEQTKDVKPAQETVNQDGDETEDGAPTWRQVALRLDKLTLFVYLILVTGFTALAMILMVTHYHSAYKQTSSII